MTTPSGQIAFSQVNAELGVSPTSTQANLGSAPFRTLAGVPSGQISMSNLQNKSNVISATGGTVIDSGGYRIHVFTSPGSFVVSNAGPGTVEYLVVAGGGSSGVQFYHPTFGFRGAGGAGAGGFRTGTGFPITATTYPITVGGGGASAGAYPPTGSSPDGNNGNPSIFSTITSAGGGAGGGRGTQGLAGGSGGGGGSDGTPGGSGNTPPTSPPQGNDGELGSGPGGGGGGGAGAPGGPSRTGGDGSPITWLPASYGTPGPAPGRYFAGGGAGGRNQFSSPTGDANGGAGGGAPNAQFNATVNTGGGGAAAPGGGGSFPITAGSGAGGSGIVAIRYPI